MLDFPIIDAHVHLVDQQRLKYAWMAGAPALNRNWTPADLTARAKPYDIGGYVFVEVDVDALLHMDEAVWVDEVAKTDPRLKGCVTSLPLELGPQAIEADIAKLATLETIRGVRRLIQDRPDPEFMIRPDGLQALRRPDRGRSRGLDAGRRAPLHPQRARVGDSASGGRGHTHQGL